MNVSRLWLIFAIVAMTASSARADMGTPGMKRPKLTNRISMREELPDYVFVVLKHRPYFAKQDEPEKVAEFVHLTIGKPIEVTGHRRQNAELFVVPRKMAANYRTALEVAEAAPRIPNAVKLSLSFDESVPAWYSDDFTIDYRVQSSGDGIEFVRTTWRPANQCWVVCIAFPIATIFGGLWLVRRWRRTRVSR